MIQQVTFGVNLERIALIPGWEKESSTCCGVNLAFAEVWGYGFGVFRFSDGLGVLSAWGLTGCWCNAAEFSAGRCSGELTVAKARRSSSLPKSFRHRERTTAPSALSEARCSARRSEPE